MNDLFSGIAELPLDATSKGAAPKNGPIRFADVGKQGWNVLRGDLMFPVLTVHHGHLQTNLRLLRDFADHHGVSLAPHGKTMMCPQLYRDCLETGGAWGITAATVQQAYVVAGSGAPNVLIANEIVGPANVRQLVRLKQRYPRTAIYQLVDSEATVQYLVRHGGPLLSSGTRFQVLLEAGFAGGRTGVRSLAQAGEVIRAIQAASGTLELAGIESYEGIIHVPDDPVESVRRVDGVLDFTLQVLELARSSGALARRDEVLLTAGGSTYFDRVARTFAMAHRGPGARVVLRGGCYVTHDHGYFAQKLREMDQRRGMEVRRGSVSAATEFAPALELWSMVEALPDPGVAILTMGARDMGWELGFPVPLRQYRDARPVLDLAGRDGWQVLKINDQHAYMAYPAASDIAVGDLFAFGVSHPCTTFDKWDVLYRVDERYDVMEALKTFF
jgi:D-serine dehydratase